MLSSRTILNATQEQLDAKRFYLDLPSSTLEGHITTVDVMGEHIGYMRNGELDIHEIHSGGFDTQSLVSILGLNILFRMSQISRDDFEFLLDEFERNSLILGMTVFIDVGDDTGTDVEDILDFSRRGFSHTRLMEMFDRQVLGDPVINDDTRVLFYSIHYPVDIWNSEYVIHGG